MPWTHGRKVWKLLALVPFDKRADVLGSQREQDVEFWRILFLTIVRSDQNTERLGLLDGAATRHVGARVNADMTRIDC